MGEVGDVTRKIDNLIVISAKVISHDAEVKDFPKKVQTTSPEIIYVKLGMSYPHEEDALIRWAASEYIGGWQDLLDDGMEKFSHSIIQTVLLNTNTLRTMLKDR